MLTVDQIDEDHSQMLALAEGARIQRLERAAVKYRAKAARADARIKAISRVLTWFLLHYGLKEMVAREEADQAERRLKEVSGE